MGEYLEVESKTFKIQTNLRQWAAVIEAADYFIGCDSVGQHMAYAFDKPGTVILGSTFVENVSYADHFQIIQKQPLDIKYSPLRIAEQLDADLANRYNDSCMDFDEAATKNIIEKIRADIKKKI
jgi:ADP-heptose:LPS heptosyltransferase